MRDYELLLVIRPTLDNTAAITLSKEIGELLEKNESAITGTNVWGRRKLAYPIDNQIEATYILLKCQITPSRLPEIEFSLKLNESLLRYMVVRDHSPAATDVQDTAETTEASTPVDEAPAVEAESTTPESNTPEATETVTEATTEDATSTSETATPVAEASEADATSEETN